MVSLKSVGGLLRETFAEWNEDKAARLGAALAYYTVFSLAPLLIIATAIAGLAFGQQAAQGRIVGQIQGLVGREGAQLIETMIESARQPAQGFLAAAVGVATLLLGALGVFGQLQDALNTIWGVAPKPGRRLKRVIQERFVSFALVLGVGFLLLVSLVVSAGLAAVGEYSRGLLPDLAVILGIANTLVSLAVISLLFALLLKFLPATRIGWRDVWLGAALSSLLFTIGKYLIGLYLGRSGIGSAYGATGSLVVLLVWIYYSAQILLFGAEFTQVYARRFGSEATGSLKPPGRAAEPDLKISRSRIRSDDFSRPA